MWNVRQKSKSGKSTKEIPKKNQCEKHPIHILATKRKKIQQKNQFKPYLKVETQSLKLNLLYSYVLRNHSWLFPRKFSYDCGPVGVDRIWIRDTNRFYKRNAQKAQNTTRRSWRRNSNFRTFVGTDLLDVSSRKPPTPRKVRSPSAPIASSSPTSGSISGTTSPTRAAYNTCTLPRAPRNSSEWTIGRRRYDLYTRAMCTIVAIPK